MSAAIEPEMPGKVFLQELHQLRLFGIAFAGIPEQRKRGK